MVAVEVVLEDLGVDELPGQEPAGPLDLPGFVRRQPRLLLPRILLGRARREPFGGGAEVVQGVAGGAGVEVGGLPVREMGELSLSGVVAAQRQLQRDPERAAQRAWASRASGTSPARSSPTAITSIP